MKTTTPVNQDLILIGGGHAHVQVLTWLLKKPLAGVRTTLINSTPTVIYSGMLPGYIAGNYQLEDLLIDLPELCTRADVDFIQSDVSGLNCLKQFLTMPPRPALRYDWLSINCGSLSNISAIDGAMEVGVPLRPLANFLQYLDNLSVQVQGLGQVHISIVGGGAGAFELAMALQHRFKRVLKLPKVQIDLLYSSDFLLPVHNNAVARLAKMEAQTWGINLLANFKVIKVCAGVLYSDAGHQHSHGELFWIPGAASQPWLLNSGLNLDAKGFIKVNKFLVSQNFANVFAVGDIATVSPFDCPKSGVYAVRQGAVLSSNIAKKMQNLKLKAFTPQKTSLNLISLGKRKCLISFGNLGLPGGSLAWWWKDYLDRRFIQKFKPADKTTKFDSLDYFPFKKDNAVELNGDMLCGGCGSKIGSDLLTRVLRAQGLCNDALRGPGDDAVILNISDKYTQIQTIDGFRGFLRDSWLMGVIATEHALNDIYAMGGQAHSALAWVTVASSGPAIMETDLSLALSGIQNVLVANNAKLIGGQSTEGAEFSIGLTINGILHGEPWAKAGLCHGDLLFLTKPIGSGAILAAYARGLCKTSWLMSALALMTLSNRDVVPVLSRYNIRSCTDISGFGLLGHAMEMAVAANVSIILDVGMVPILDGTLQCFSANIVSSLQSSNEQNLDMVDFIGCTSADIDCRVLADPMTSGGLLFAISKNQALACKEEIRALGLPVEQIGEVVAVKQKPIVFLANRRTTRPTGLSSSVE